MQIGFAPACLSGAASPIVTQTHVCISPPSWDLCLNSTVHTSQCLKSFLDLKSVVYPTMLLPVYFWTPLKCSSQSKLFVGKREERVMTITADASTFPWSWSQSRAKQLSQALESHIPMEVNLYLYTASQSRPHLACAGSHCRWNRAEQLSDPLSTSSSVKPLIAVDSALAEVQLLRIKDFFLSFIPISY